MPASRPSLRLDSLGVCNACRWQENKKNINWEARKEEFNEVVDWAKNHSLGEWNCILGVSGGKDSTWQAMQLRDQLGLNPLLVQFVSSDGNELGRDNIENLVRLGFSLISVQPNPKISKILSRESFLRYGNLHKYAEMALFAIPFRTAIQYDIPLVFFGENPALEAGDCNTGEGWDAKTIYNNHTLGGDSYKIWLSDEVSEGDLIQYQFPTPEEFQSWNGKGIFMGYYFNWSSWNNAVFSIRNGMQCQKADYKDIGSHYKHNSLDSDYGGIVNAMLKHIKFGFGNTTEHACYDVRNGRITREEASVLARELDGKCHPRYIQAYCDWIGISIDKFWEVANRYRGNMWEKNNDNQWIIKNPIWEQVDCSIVTSYETVIQKVENLILEKD